MQLSHLHAANQARRALRYNALRVTRLNVLHVGRFCNRRFFRASKSAPDLFKRQSG